MKSDSRGTTLAVAIACSLSAGVAFADESPAPVTTVGPVTITATKIGTPQASLPAMLTVVTGEELRARGARDLRTALQLVGGVDIAPGGDAGPAGSVPAMWGLREIDAFLLVVDGVPFGGAFNPATAVLDLAGVDRIEVLRGAAPVTYGATSFVGVIHVLHSTPRDAATRVELAGGDPGTYLGTLVAPLPQVGDVAHSLLVSGERREFDQDDADAGRAHALYRAELARESGTWRADLDLVRLRQSPASPHPREGAGMSARFPLDANANPADARQDQDRAQATLGFRPAAGASGPAFTLSAAHTTLHSTRGFLREDFATDGTTVNADGFRQRVRIDDVYADLSWQQAASDALTWAVGVDWLYGHARQGSENFEYAVLPSGADRVSSFAHPVDETTALTIRRNFGGAYAQADWKPLPRWTILAGARLDRTEEEREGAVVSSDPNAPEEGGRASEVHTRGSGSIGSSFEAWRSGADRLTVYADWRSSFKPAAADLGPEAEVDLLQPESARSGEIGVRGTALDGHLSFDASAFRMKFRNLVIRENVGGLPALANAGSQKLRGLEVESRYELLPDTQVMFSFAKHRAQFEDYARLRPDGSLQQLAGKDIELSPRTLGSFGVLHAPREGLTASLVWSHTGARFLNKGNTVRASGFSMLDSSVGWRTHGWDVRLEGYNLTDRRDPVAESELGDAQFYRLSGRSVLVSVAHMR